MTFKFECPVCNQRISAALTDIGTSGGCPACGNDFIVPAPSNEPPTPVPPPLPPSTQLQSTADSLREQLDTLNQIQAWTQTRNKPPPKPRKIPLSQWRLMFLSLFIVVGPMLVVRERDHTAKRERMAREGIPVQADIVDRKVVTSGGKHKHTHVDITVKFALENGSNQLARLSLSNDNFKQLALGSDIRLRYLRNDPFHPSVFDEEVHQDSEYVIAGALTVLGLIGVLFGWWPLIRDKWRARKAEG